MRRSAFSAAIVTVLLCSGAAPAAADGLTPGLTLVAHLSNGHWSRVASPNASGGSTLNGVVALSRSNVWAVGGHRQGQNEKPLIEHWNGSHWAIANAPGAPGGSVLHGVDAATAGQIWAVGARGDGQPLVFRRMHGSWSLVDSPLVTGGGLNAVAARTTTDVWAVGSRSNGLQPLTEHWNGASWSTVAAPKAAGNNALLGVVALTATNAWAVGSSGGGGGNNPTKTLVEHWNGTKWSIVHSPNVGTMGSSLAAVAAGGAHNVTAVGSYINGQGCLQTLVEHWNGTRWSRVASPNAGPCDSELNGVTQDGHHVWAVGQRVDKPQSSPITVGMALVKTSSGWKMQDSTIATRDKLNELNGVSVVPSTRNVWAVGVGTNAAAG